MDLVGTTASVRDGVGRGVDASASVSGFLLVPRVVEQKSQSLIMAHKASCGRCLTGAAPQSNGVLA